MSSAGRRLRAGVALTLVASLGVGACSDPSGPGPSAPSSTPVSASTTASASATAERERIAADLLDRHVSALTRHDANALRSTLLDPDSAFGRDELAALAVIEQLPVTGLRIGTVRTSDLPGGPSPDAFAATATTTYRFAGYDTGDRSVETGFVLRRGPKGWRIAGTDADQGGSSTRLPWQLPGATVIRTERALVVGAVGREELTRLSERAEHAIDVVEELWTARWPRRLVVLAPATGADYRGQLGAAADADAEVAAVTDGRVGPDGLAHADRIVLSPDAMTALRPDGRDVVLTHEALHVAMRASVAGRPPLWVSEGYAELAGYRAPARRLGAAQVVGPLREQVARDGLPEGLPDDTAFATGSASLAPAYNAAWVAMSLLLERIGPTRLTAFATAAASTGSATDVTEAAEAALRRQAGLDPAGFTALWRQRVADLTG